ncbi:unnamed protein product [Coregonus sp. 'balchen']|nr:unnamed protein product [Coregonus sp. 'balchen']
MTNRFHLNKCKPQYVYVRERRDIDVDGRKIWVVLAKSSPQSPLPEKSGVQRSGVPAFLTDMQKACGNYSNYCQKNKK